MNQRLEFLRINLVQGPSYKKTAANKLVNKELSYRKNAKKSDFSEANFSKNSLIKIFLLYWIFSAIPVSSFGQTFKDGLNKYTSGNITGTEKSLKLALTRTRDTPTRIKIYKLLAISQFMLGKKERSAENFKLALKLKPDLTVRPNEVLDEKILPFFYSVKSGKTKFTRSSQSYRSSTQVIVYSNAKKAKIYQNGRIIGVSGRPFKVKPGIFGIVVKARGYLTKRSVIRVSNNMDNFYQVKLTKITDPYKTNSSFSQYSGSYREDFIPAAKRYNPPFENKYEDRDPFGDMDYLLGGKKRRKKIRSKKVSYKVTSKKPRTKKSRQSTIKRASGPLPTAIYFLPFGGGHFAMSKNIKGFLYGTAQAGALYLYFLRKSEAEQFENQALQDYQNSDADEETKRQFLIEADRFVKQKKQEANIGLMGFIGIWGVAALDAYINRPGTRRNKLSLLKPEIDRHGNLFNNTKYQITGKSPNEPISLNINYNQLILSEYSSYKPKNNVILDFSVNF